VIYLDDFLGDFLGDDLAIEFFLATPAFAFLVKYVLTRLSTVLALVLTVLAGTFFPMAFFSTTFPRETIALQDGWTFPERAPTGAFPLGEADLDLEGDADRDLGLGEDDLDLAAFAFLVAARFAAARFLADSDILPAGLPTFLFLGEADRDLEGDADRDLGLGEADRDLAAFAAFEAETDNDFAIDILFLIINKKLF
jgi:hypothetical protein